MSAARPLSARHQAFRLADELEQILGLRFESQTGLTEVRLVRPTKSICSAPRRCPAPAGTGGSACLPLPLRAGTSEPRPAEWTRTDYAPRPRCGAEHPLRTAFTAYVVFRSTIAAPSSVSVTRKWPLGDIAMSLSPVVPLGKGSSFPRVRVFMFISTIDVVSKQ